MSLAKGALSTCLVHGGLGSFRKFGTGGHTCAGEGGLVADAGEGRPWSPTSRCGIKSTR
jgi:hypothetical protein